MRRASFAITVAIGLILGLVSMETQASVVYQWHTVENGKMLFPTSGRLVVTQQAWQAGSLNVNYGGAYNYDTDLDKVIVYPIPDSPILDMSFTVNGKTMSFQPRTGKSNFADWYLDADLKFTDDTISGGLSINNSESSATMGGNSDLWTISHFSSDDDRSGCFEDPGCSGATGKWVLNALPPDATDTVSEPGSLALFGLGLGLLGLGAHRRHQA